MIDATLFRPVGAAPPGYPYAQAINVYGNIDMLNRPSVVNADGSISTVRSISIEQSVSFMGVTKTLHVLIPTVHDNGYIMTDANAIKEYKTTGKHLGKFDTKKDVSRYSIMLHDMEEARINGREYEQPFSSPDQTAIYDAVTSFKVNYALTAGAEISVDFADYQGQMFLNNYFQIGQQYFYRDEPFQMASVEVAQGEGEYWSVRCKLRTWQQQQMKEDLHPEVLKSANGYDFAEKLAKKYGLAFIGEEVKGKQQEIKVKTKNNKESSWDVLQRSANDNQYYAFIAQQTLFFCSPLFLLGQWGIDEVVGAKITKAGSFAIGNSYAIAFAGDTSFVAIGAANNTPTTIFTATGAGTGTGTAYKIIRYVPLVYPTPESETRFLLMGLPEMRSSFDSPKEGEGSAQLWRDNATQLRAGMTVYVKQMGIYDGAYIISSVDYSEGVPEPVSISFATVSKLAPEDKKKVDEKIAETTVISGSK